MARRTATAALTSSRAAAIFRDMQHAYILQSTNLAKAGSGLFFRASVFTTLIRRRADIDGTLAIRVATATICYRALHTAAKAAFFTA